MSEKDYLLTSYTFDLPPECIAQEPPKTRGSSRLLVHNRKTHRNTATTFEALPQHLEPGLIVVNNSRVVPARVFGTRDSGGKVEFLLTTPLPHIEPQNVLLNNNPSGFQSASVSCLLKSSKKVREGETVSLGENFSAHIRSRGEYGQCTAELRWKGSLPEVLRKEGVMPLPPYIKRPQNEEDSSRYQTVYAEDAKAGSIAAPTAGLHFTETMRRALEGAGFTWAEVTLYVGYGTFSPVRVEDIRNHAMHREYCEISAETAATITEAKRKGLAVTAVGTTAARTLEGVMERENALVPFSGWTDIFLYPGRPIRVVDHLLTNFHLPESTLLMLVSAFAGREAMLEAYALAVQERFRFFSYGDAMLVL